MPENDDLSVQTQVTDRTHTGVPQHADTGAPSARQKSARRRSARVGAAVNNHMRVRFANARFLG